ncbi:hypothetical protein GCM10029978_060980 [Actinoallomurus acanthiterrae]
MTSIPASSASSVAGLRDGIAVLLFPGSAPVRVKDDISEARIAVPGLVMFPELMTLDTYPAALVVMALGSFLPYLVFKRRKWL